MVQIITSPALVSGFDSIETAPFTAPAGALLLAAWAGYDLTTVSGGGLTWTSRAEQGPGNSWNVQLWTAPCPSTLTGITVTTPDSFPIGGLKAWVLTGVHPLTPVGNTGTGSTATNNATIDGYTSTQGGSLGFCVAFEAALFGGGLPTSTDVAAAYSMDDAYGDNGSGLVLNKAAPTGASGQVVTFNLDAPGSGTADWRWAAIEILSAPGARRVSARPVLTAVNRSTIW